ncbi:MAG: hypothetical protein K8H84_07805 [Sulfuricella denitrificans]|nr:hypothetical protein [Sulfuricella denitrificans]
MQFLQILKLIISLLPLLVDAIKTIEAAMPGSGQGVAKLEALRTIMQSSYSGAADAIGTFEQIWPKIQDVAGGLVAAFNKSGMFGK